MRASRLESLFLFLTFKDHYAAKNYCLDNLTVLVILAAILPTTILLVSGLLLLTLSIHPALFVLAFVSLQYGLLQMGHLYDYHRGRAR
jgi:hypothetical protein